MPFVALSSRNSVAVEHLEAVENLAITRENTHDFRKKPKIIENVEIADPLSTKEPPGEIDPYFSGP
jgi:hypothetical protein